MDDKGINFMVDNKLYKQVKIRIAQEDKSLKEYMTKLIVNDLQKSSK